MLQIDEPDRSNNLSKKEDIEVKSENKSNHEKTYINHDKKHIEKSESPQKKNKDGNILEKNDVSNHVNKTDSDKKSNKRKLNKSDIESEKLNQSTSKIKKEKDFSEFLSDGEKLDKPDTETNEPKQKKLKLDKSLNESGIFFYFLKKLVNYLMY